jgi:hypothetical protein
MNELKKYTMTYYNFFEMDKMVKEKLSFNTRDCGKYYYPNELKPPYLDFWHWQCDNCFFRPVFNDTYNKLYIGLEKQNITFWQLDIQKIWNELFKHLADESGYINIWISW